VTSDGLLLFGNYPAATDSDGDGVPDVVEQQAGTSSHNPFDAPLVGIPDRPVLDSPTEAQYVTYDFSRIPGYSQSKAVAIPVQPGNFKGDTVPFVLYKGTDVTAPSIRRRDFVQAGGYFQVHASIEPGKTIDMTLPFPDAQIPYCDSSFSMALRYDTTEQEWQRLEVTGFDGAVHVRTTKFSEVAVGFMSEPKSIAAGDSHFVVIDSIDQAGVTLYRVLQYDRMSQNTLVPIYDLPTDVRSLESGSPTQTLFNQYYCSNTRWI